ncbi:hypothetical protein [Allonocardiopsis opalescens]|uniref:Uncharacterized protein n=1 Tax=Allonocardiopsis opalescens TaxID=1144618 RepID=A0A2T0Q5K3_9ACTN|nr:hypothetical protein [Allonocardiopsis opalescens]PRX99063.1 hypothetical protein CLV72_104643 [Allonocardiopsis opalescens]
MTETGDVGAYDADDDDEELVRPVLERMADPAPGIPMEQVIAEFTAERD